MILIIVLYMIIASSFTVGKAALSYASPIFFTGFRLILSGSILLGYLRFFNTKHWKYVPSDASILGKLTLFHIYISYVCEYIGLQYLVSSKACLLFNFSPFITALLAYWLFSERLTQKKIVGLCIGVIGFIPIIINSPNSEGVSFLYFSYPEIALLVSVFSSAYGWILMKELITKRGYSPLMANGISMFYGGIAALATSLLYEKGIAGKALFLGSSSTDMLVFLGYTILIIIITNIIFYNLYGYLLQFYSTTFLSFAGFITPFFAALYGYLLLGEVVSHHFFASLAILIVGLYLFYREELSFQA